MIKQLYVFTQNFGGGFNLLGQLTNNNGQFVFQYHHSLPNTYDNRIDWLVPGMEDTTKQYSSDEVFQNLILRAIPNEDFMFTKEILEAAGLSEYDPWLLLITQMNRFQTEKTMWGDQKRHICFSDNLNWRYNVATNSNR